MQKQIKKALNWLTKGGDGKVHLIQFPNTPLIGWLIFLIVSNLVAERALKISFTTLSMVFLRSGHI